MMHFGSSIVATLTHLSLSNGFQFTDSTIRTAEMFGMSRTEEGRNSSQNLTYETCFHLLQRGVSQLLCGSGLRKQRVYPCYCPNSKNPMVPRDDVSFCF